MSMTKADMMWSDGYAEGRKEAAAEVERLREALRLIADTGHGTAKVWFMGNWLTSAGIARAALNNGGEG